jgi:hypothetical protein
MTTVGFGDIVPVNSMEYIYVICIALVSSFIFAYTVNKIGGIFQD